MDLSERQIRRLAHKVRMHHRRREQWVRERGMVSCEEHQARCQSRREEREADLYRFMGSRLPTPQAPPPTSASGRGEPPPSPRREGSRSVMSGPAAALLAAAVGAARKLMPPG